MTIRTITTTEIRLLFGGKGSPFGSLRYFDNIVAQDTPDDEMDRRLWDLFWWAMRRHNEKVKVCFENRRIREGRHSTQKEREANCKDLEQRAKQQARKVENKPKALAYLGGICQNCNSVHKLEFAHLHPKGFNIGRRLGSKDWSKIQGGKRRGPAFTQSGTSTTTHNSGTSQTACSTKSEISAALSSMLGFGRPSRQMPITRTNSSKRSLAKQLSGLTNSAKMIASHPTISF